VRLRVVPTVPRSIVTVMGDVRHRNSEKDRLLIVGRDHSGERAHRVEVGGAAGPPVVLVRLGCVPGCAFGRLLGLVGVPEAVAAQAQLYTGGGVGEAVAPGAEGGEVGGEQGGAGAVEASGRRVPGFLQYGESLGAALPPGGDRAGQVGGGTAGGGGQR